MKWGIIKNHNKGQTRIILKFLWLPLKLQNQTRWLEMGMVKQWRNPYTYQWENIEWADDAKLVDCNGKKCESEYEETIYDIR